MSHKPLFTVIVSEIEAALSTLATQGPDPAAAEQLRQKVGVLFGVLTTSVLQPYEQSMVNALLERLKNLNVRTHEAPAPHTPVLGMDGVDDTPADARLRAVVRGIKRSDKDETPVL